MKDIIPRLADAMREIVKDRFPAFDPWTTDIVLWDDGDYRIEVKHTDDDNIQHVLYHHSSETPWGLVYRQQWDFQSCGFRVRDVCLVAFDGCEDEVQEMAKVGSFR